MLPTRDGKLVPVSVVYKKGFHKDGEGKLYLYAYGAYGHAIPPSFSTARLSLIDRGFACAIAHIRGGDDLGYGWFLEGKRSEEHTSELQSLMRISYAVFCLKKKTTSYIQELRS